MYDGSSSVDEAVAVLNELKKQNINNVFLTPSYLNTGETVRAFIKRRNNAYSLMTGKIPRGMHVYLAAQILFFNDTLDNCYISRLTYQKSPYLFIDLPIIDNLEWLESELHYLLYKTKLIPVFANFERYSQIYSPQLFKYLINIPYAIYQFNSYSLNETVNIEIINKLCTKSKTIIFGSKASNVTDKLSCMTSNIENLKNYISIENYRELIIGGRKFYNKIMR